MQVQSIIEAWCEIRTEGIDVVPESMVPLVAVGAEMNAEKELIQMVADETMARQDMCVSYHVGIWPLIMSALGLIGFLSSGWRKLRQQLGPRLLLQKLHG